MKTPTSAEIETATRREWWLLLDETSNRALARGPGEKWEDDVNGKPSRRFVHAREVLPGDEEKILVSLQELTDWAWANFAKEDCGYIARVAERLFDEFNEKGPKR